MSTLSGIFLKGLAALLPAAITVAILVWLATSSERLVAGMLRPYLGEWYVPGMGIIGVIILIFMTGLLMQAYLIRRLVSLGETILTRIPVVKTIYASVQDLMLFVSKSKERTGQQVVMVDISLGDYRAKIMGFVTRDDFSEVPDGIGGPDMVSVYCPMSYQIGGYTLTVPKERVTPVAMSMEQGMRYAITGGLTGAERKEGDGAAEVRTAQGEMKGD